MPNITITLTATLTYPIIGNIYNKDLAYNEILERDITDVKFRPLPFVEQCIDEGEIKVTGVINE